MIKNNEQTQAYYFKEGCWITELWNEDSDSEVSIAKVSLPAGQKTLPHYLANTSERYLITAGTGMVYLQNQSARKVTAGDVVYIQPGIIQSIANPETQTDLEFLAICSPRFEEKNYFAA